MPGKCPFCNQNAENIPVTGYPATTYTCKFCGEFTLARDAYADEVSRMTKEQKMRIASFTKARTIRGQEPIWIFSKQEYCTSEFKVPTAGLDFILQSFPTKISDRFTKVLLNLGQCTTHFGDDIEFEPLKDLPLFFASTATELVFICQSLEERNYITKSFGVLKTASGGSLITSVNENGNVSVQLTSSGLNHIAELEESHIASLSKQVFVAMHFDTALDTAFDAGIKLAINDCGFKDFRVDRNGSTGKIDDDIFVGIRESKFMVADVTNHRQAVYFEAGLMMGLGREVIFTIQDKTHDNGKTELDSACFDTRQYVHIVWKDPADLRKQLATKIKAKGLSLK